MTLEFWAMAMLAVAMLLRLRYLEEEREAMRAWHRGELAAREKLQGELAQLVGLTEGAAKEGKALVAKLDAAEASLVETTRTAEMAKKWADHLLAERVEVEGLVELIHQQLKRGKATADHGLILNLRCILEQVTPEVDPLEVNP